MVDAQATVAIAKGDRIKMTAATLHMLENNPYSARRSVKWKQRRGTVVRVSRPTQCVCIKWDDRVTLDFWPLKAVELVKPHARAGAAIELTGIMRRKNSGLAGPQGTRARHSRVSANGQRDRQLG
jgi:hypothetical protein